MELVWALQLLSGVPLQEKCKTQGWGRRGRDRQFSELGEATRWEMALL